MAQTYESNAIFLSRLWKFCVSMIERRFQRRKTNLWTFVQLPVVEWLLVDSHPNLRRQRRICDAFREFPSDPASFTCERERKQRKISGHARKKPEITRYTRPFHVQLNRYSQFRVK